MTGEKKNSTRIPFSSVLKDSTERWSKGIFDYYYYYEELCLEFHWQTMANENRHKNWTKNKRNIMNEMKHKKKEKDKMSRRAGMDLNEKCNWWWWYRWMSWLSWSFYQGLKFLDERLPKVHANFKPQASFDAQFSVSFTCVKSLWLQ